MYSLRELLVLLEGIAPLEISYKMIEKGDYDNSGIIIENTNTVSKILFSLDLSVESLDKAKEFGCDTIVTHHPAIYNPVKRLSYLSDNKEVLLAIKGGFNVLSMHLNLDMAKEGIDHYLSKALGVSEYKIIDMLDDTYGYGREGEVESCSLGDYVSKISKNLGTDKIICYGDKQVSKVASFCGGGSSHAFSAVVKGQTLADTIITSDVPHHVIKEMLERGKNLIIIPHYVAEEYGFNQFYKSVSERLGDRAKTFYFVDKRFM